MPSYAETKGIVQREAKTEGELKYKIKELEKEPKKREKQLAEEKEKVEILKRGKKSSTTARCSTTGNVCTVPWGI